MEQQANVLAEAPDMCLLRLQGAEAKVNEQEEARELRRRWMAGRCPCCGGGLYSWPGPDGVEHQPEAIGEGVMMCGRCMGNEHYIETADLILKALAQEA